MAAGGGGAWKVAYADFVTAMMAFFMVMWITGQSKQMKQAVAHYFNDPFNSLSKTKGPEPPGSRHSTHTIQPGDPQGSRRPKDAPPVIGPRIDEQGTKKWAGEGNKSAS